MTAQEKSLEGGVNLFSPIEQARPSVSLFPLRDNEPEYALLADQQTQEKNRYGQLIALTLAGKNAWAYWADSTSA